MSLLDIIMPLLLSSTILILISILMFRRGWIGPSAERNVSLSPNEDGSEFNKVKFIIIVGGTIVMALVLYAYVIYLAINNNTISML